MPVMKRTMRKYRRAAKQLLKTEISATGTFSGGLITITAANFGLLLSRPSRTHYIKVTAASPSPIDFNFSIYGPNGEIVAVAPVTVVGNRGQTFYLRMPAGTDFGNYTGANPLLTMYGPVGATNFCYAIELCTEYGRNLRNAVTM